jgi:hypothetical protein
MEPVLIFDAQYQRDSGSLDQTSWSDTQSRIYDMNCCTIHIIDSDT